MDLKKYFKDWPYWLNGGTITLLIFIVISLVLIPAGKFGNTIIPYAYIPSILGFYLVLNYNITNFWAFFVMGVLTAIFYFLIGILIAWIIFKLRDRKKSKISKPPLPKTKKFNKNQDMNIFDRMMGNRNLIQRKERKK